METYNTTIQTLPNLPNAVNLWTDGSADYRDRSGGFAYIVQEGPPAYTIRASYAQSVRDTTVSRMELTAALRGLESLKVRSVVQLITDSEYLAKGLVYFMNGWRRDGWQIKNSDLWILLYEQVRDHHDVFVTVIKGHSDVVLNEEVDRLASQARKGLKV